MSFIRNITFENAVCKLSTILCMCYECVVVAPRESAGISEVMVVITGHACPQENIICEYRAWQCDTAHSLLTETQRTNLRWCNSWDDLDLNRISRIALHVCSTRNRGTYGGIGLNNNFLDCLAQAVHSKKGIWQNKEFRDDLSLLFYQKPGGLISNEWI